jgi:hypothetical protein
MSNGPEFFQTRMGMRFFEAEVPRFLKAVERIADALAAMAPEGGTGKREPQRCKIEWWNRAGEHVVKTYEFASEAEMKAFLKGAGESTDWSEFLVRVQGRDADYDTAF